MLTVGGALKCLQLYPSLKCLQLSIDSSSSGAWLLKDGPEHLGLLLSVGIVAMCFVPFSTEKNLVSDSMGDIQARLRVCFNFGIEPDGCYCCLCLN